MDRVVGFLSTDAGDQNMSTKQLAGALLLCSTAYAATNTKPVGTVILRGDMRIDGNQVTSDATLFDGSTVETAEASATLHLNANADIMMTAGTRSIVHDGYVKLEQGKIDVKPTCGFVVEANGVRITPSSANSHAVISSNASVTALTGEFLILDNQGRVLSRIRNGTSQAFGTGQAQPTGPATYAGALSNLDNHSMLTLFGPDNNVTYELQGRSANKVQGKFVLVNGTIDPKRTSVYTQEVISTTKGAAMCTAGANPYPWLLSAAAVAALGGGIAAAVALDQPATPASR